MTGGKKVKGKWLNDCRRHTHAIHVRLKCEQHGKIHRRGYKPFAVHLSRNHPVNYWFPSPFSVFPTSPPLIRFNSLQLNAWQVRLENRGNQRIKNLKLTNDLVGITSNDSKNTGFDSKMSETQNGTEIINIYCIWQNSPIILLRWYFKSAFRLFLLEFFYRVGSKG